MNIGKSILSTLGTWLYEEKRKIQTIHSRPDSKCIFSSILYPIAGPLCKSKTEGF